MPPELRILFETQAQRPLLEYFGTPISSGASSMESLPPLEDLPKLTPERKKANHAYFPHTS